MIPGPQNLSCSQLIYAFFFNTLAPSLVGYFTPNIICSFDICSILRQWSNDDCLASLTITKKHCGSALKISQDF